MALTKTSTEVVLALPCFSSTRSTGENLGVTYVVSALLESGLSTRVVNLDGTLTREEILREILTTNPEFVGFGVPSYHLLPSLEELAREVKRQIPSLRLFAGGHYLVFREHWD